MATTTLGGVALPPDLRWTDEFSWSEVKVKRDISLAGNLVMQVASVLTGRPITLASGDSSAWLRRSQIAALVALRDLPELTPMSLVLPDARAFSVVFDLTGDEAIRAEPIRPGKFVAAADYFRVTLKLFTV